MFTVYLNKSIVFSYKRALFFVGKIGVVKVNLPANLIDIFFYIDESFMKIRTSTLNKTNVDLIESILSKVNKTLAESNLGFTNKIILFGIGFRSWTYKVNNGTKYLILKIGFSRDLFIEIPSTVKIIILKPTLILFKGLDKKVLNQFVASLRLLKVPDCYKGKGLRYIEEKIIIKAGKT